MRVLGMTLGSRLQCLFVTGCRLKHCAVTTGVSLESLRGICVVAFLEHFPCFLPLPPIMLAAAMIPRHSTAISPALHDAAAFCTYRAKAHTYAIHVAKGLSLRDCAYLMVHLGGLASSR